MSQSGILGPQSGSAIGDVTGPASSTDNAVARFNGTTGKIIQNSVVIVDDSGNVSGVGSLTTSGIATLGSGQIVKNTVPGSYPYDVLTSDYIIEVDTSSARTIRLPNAPTTGSVWVIKDDVGSASTNNITLTTVGGAVTIDGSASQTLNGAWQSVTVYFNGTSYRII